MHPAPGKAVRFALEPRARGGAMVEFALLNIVLVPLLLYAIFLMDAAYLKLDLQETVVSGVWDFSTRNVEPPGMKEAGKANLAANQDTSVTNQLEVDATAKAIRVVYADHTSAFDDGADPYNSSTYSKSSYLRGDGGGGEHMKHHTGFGAQYSFKYMAKPDDEEEGLEGDTQFKCSQVQDMGWSNDPEMKRFATSGYTAGTYVQCSATGFIYNYIVPQTFLQEFSKVKMTEMKLRTGTNTTDQGVHEWQGEGNDIANIVAYETAGISFNTWALRNGARNSSTKGATKGGSDYYVPKYDGKVADANIRIPQIPKLPVPTPTMEKDTSPEANPFFRRVQYLYAKNGAFAATYGAVEGAAANFTNTAFNEKLMAVQTVPLSTMSGAILPNIIGVHVTARYVPNNPGQRQAKPKLLGGEGGVGGSGFLSTPYSGPNNDYVTAAGARGVFYLGCKSKETPSCF